MKEIKRSAESRKRLKDNRSVKKGEKHAEIFEKEEEEEKVEEDYRIPSDNLESRKIIGK